MKALKRKLAFTLPGLAFLALGGCILLSPREQRPPADLFLQAKGELQMGSMELDYGTPTVLYYNFELGNSAGHRVRGRFRTPQDEGSHPALFLVGAYEAGNKMIDFIQSCPEVTLVSIDYPFGNHTFQLATLIRDVRELREEGIQAVGDALLTLDWLAGTKPDYRPTPPLDVSDITVAAVSFGTFTAVPAAALNPHASRLVILQGGGELQRIVSANSTRLGLPLPPAVMGWLARRWLDPFEPNRYIGMVSPRSVLIIASEGDTDFPKETTQSLYDHAAEPKQLLWHANEHFGFEKQELIQDMAAFTLDQVYGDTCAAEGP